MSDHDFEKQVQQKLNELKLRPSDTVWMEVEKNIRTTKRRRRFFWLWTPMLFICISTSAYILYRKYFSTELTTGIAQTVSSSKPNELTSETKNTDSATTNPVNAINSGHSQAEPTVANQITGNSTNEPAKPNAESPAMQQADPPSLNAEHAPGKSEQPQTPSSNSSSKNINVTASPSAKPVADKVVTANNYLTPNSSSLKREARGEAGNRRKKNIPVAAFEQPESKPTQHNSEGKTDAGAIDVITQQPSAEPAHTDYAASIPAMVTDDNDKLIATDNAMTDSLNKKMIWLSMWEPVNNTPAIAAVPIQRKRSSAWHWGIEANAGFSRISTSNLFQLKGLLSQDKYIAEDLAAPSYVFNSADPNNTNSLISYQATARTQKKAAAIQPDFSYTAGLYVQRTFSRRFRLSVALRYAYMSVYTEVGEQVVSNTPVLVNYGMNSAGIVYDYYNYAGVSSTKDTGYSISNAGFSGTGGAGSSAKPPVIQRYKYNFHYIEIPVMAHWQINKGRRLPPIVFDGGFSIARLTKVKALHYDGIKSIYYKNNSLFNKTQLNIITGISIGVLQKTKHPMWIGPDLRYSVSGLVKKEVSNGQYLWSTGINVKMLLGRL